MCGVPEEVLASHEVPTAVSFLIRVLVLNRLVTPVCAFLDLGFAIHDTMGMRVVVEIDDMVAHEEDGDADPPKLLVEILAQRDVSRRVASHAHVGDEKGDERVEITPIDSERVAVRELPDLVPSEEPFDFVHWVSGDSRLG